MKKSIFSGALLSLFSVVMLSGSTSGAETTVNKQQLKLKMGDHVIIQATADADDRFAQEGNITGTGMSDDGRIIYYVNGRYVDATRLFSTKAGSCVADKGQTLCVGDLVLEDLIDSRPTEHVVLGIQVQPSGFWSVSTNVLIKRDGRFIAKYIDELVVIPSGRR